MKRWNLLKFILCGVALLPSVFARAELKAAADKVEITPTKPAYIAGYAANRRSKGVHDPLWAKCMVVESGGVRIAIVSCDLIGISRFEGEKIRALVKSVAAERLYIAATHTHSGPDTMGQWGPDLRTSGVDQEWMAETRKKIANLVDKTAGKLQPAAVRFTSTNKVPKVSKNTRLPQILDTELGVMQLVQPSNGKAIGTLVNFACHPEVLNNRMMTADFPHWLYETVEKATGAVCLYLNGAQGGMITADFDESVLPKGENWKAAEEIGTNLGRRVLEILEGAEAQTQASITASRRVFRVPLENPMFQTLIKLKVLPAEALTEGMIETEVNRFTIGDAEFLTIPGEALPNVGFYLKSKMTGRPKFLLGLTSDFLGYILAPEDFVLKVYQYEASVSVGIQIEPLMIKHLLELCAEAKKPK